MLVDFDREIMLKDERLYTKVGWTPYLDWKVKGHMELTMLRGTVIAKDREVIGEPGSASTSPPPPVVTPRRA